MVDRIVPATDDDFREAVASVIGVDDAWPVRAEAVLAVGRRAPMGGHRCQPFGDVGVQVVDDVGPWEMLKLARPELAPYARPRTTACATGSPPSISSRPTREGGTSSTALPRRSPKCSSGRRAPTSTSTSQRRSGASPIPASATGAIRSPPTRARSFRSGCPARSGTGWIGGLGIDALADVLALWAWSTLGVDHRGDPRTVSDPLATTYARIVEECTTDRRVDTTALATALLGLPIFGDLAGNPALVGPVAARLPALLDRTEHLETKS